MANEDFVKKTTEEFERLTKEEQHEYLEAKKQYDSNRINELSSNAIADIMTDPEALEEYLIVQGRFDRLSVGNAILLYAQKPDASVLKTGEEWSKYHVSILKGEKGITLRRRDYTGKYMKGDDVKDGYEFKFYNVFDVTQTNCSPEKHKEPDIAALCDKFNKYTQYDLTAEYDEKGEYFVSALLKDIVSSNTDKQPIISACATVSVCSKLGVSVPDFLRMALANTLPNYVDKSPKDFKEEVLNPARLITRTMVQEFVLGKENKEKEIDDLLPFEIEEDDEVSSPPEKKRNGQAI